MLNGSKIFFPKLTAIAKSRGHRAATLYLRSLLDTNAGPE